MLMYWWISIFRPQDWMYWDISSLRIPAIILVLFILKSLISNGLPRLDNKITWLLLIWLLLAIAASAVNGCDQLYGSTPSRYVFLFLAVIFTAELLNSKKRVYIFVLLIVISISFHAANLGINSILSGGSSSYAAQIGAGSFTGSNAFAMGAALVALYFPFLYLNSEIILDNLSAPLKTIVTRKTVNLLFAILFFGSVYSIVSLFSRGSVLALGLGIVVFIWLQKKRAKWIFNSIILLIISLAVIPIPSGYIERIESVFVDSKDMDNSAKSRPHFWDTAKIMVKANPGGVGIGCFPNYYNSYDTSNAFFGSYRSVHSSHFQILSETGYAGFFFWALVFIVSFFKLLSIRKKCLNDKLEGKDDNKFYLSLSISVFCSLLIFVAGGSFYEFSHNEITWASFAVLIAIEKLVKEAKKV